MGLAAYHRSKPIVELGLGCFWVCLAVQLVWQYPRFQQWQLTTVGGDAEFPASLVRGLVHMCCNAPTEQGGLRVAIWS